MNRIVEVLKESGVFYVSTVGGDRPHLRPFSSVTEFEGNVYLCSNNKKDFYKQIVSNSSVEICGMLGDSSWIRLSGRLVRDDRDEARIAMLSDPTGPSNLYTVGDGLFEVFRLEDAVCMKYSASGTVMIEA